MFEKPQVLAIASSLATHAATRQAVVAQNVANADTPGYQAREVADFSETYRANQGDGLRQTRAGHIGAAEAGPQLAVAAPSRQALSPNGNGVSLEAEMVKAADIRREHDLALAIYGKSLAILRASLGRG
ncbi:Flagellar basal body rod protein FlgB [Defluviimonas aquaemixtae]|uniref:Flagellar basal body rod protein FlgB n=1 Tax=Albidovulum aquaemixtae TaxID=1542388 RepID=A0A2R8BJ94_9RHOB|nr:FlgB family protein [Defluviimonas aquaemixtae]SPH23448.1 Flagellar basal body rod protein FlgB [Defluviimonas aquaemixtae]